MPTIIDPALQLGGAWTCTRGLLNLLRAAPFHAEVVSVPPDERSWAAHRIRRCTALAESLVSGRPAKIQFQYSRQMLATVQRLLSEREFDVVLLNGTDLLWLLPYLPSGPAKILLAHNIEHLLYSDQIRVMLPSPGFRKAFLLRDCARLRRYELAGLCEVRNVIFLSTQDESTARAADPNINALTLPPLIEGTRATRPSGWATAPGLEIGMMANFEWWPGQHGLQWFLREVFPHLDPGIRLHLFGKRSLTVVPDQPRLVKHGYVASVEEVWSTCHIMICPVFAGGGVSVKLAEAVARGVPVLATKYAARGLNLDADPAIVLLNAAKDWVQFLNSEAPRELRRLPPSPGNTQRFSRQNAVEPLQRFLNQVRGTGLLEGQRAESATAAN